MPAIPPRDDPPDLADVARREEIREEMEAEQSSSDAALLERDARMRALLISFVLVVCILAPLVGLVAGLTVRAFCWSAGW